MDKCQKLEISMRYWLLGRINQEPEYANTLAAMDFARQHHTGVRKDGVTPEFYHQLGIMHYLRTMEMHLDFPAATLSAAALHDIHEDYNISLELIRSRFGEDVARAVFLLSKIRDGQKIDAAAYFRGIAMDRIASVVKGADRINNLQSMLGVFSDKKQIEYVDEAKTYFVPMLKAARRQFYTQEPVYENIKLMMNSQMELFSAIFQARTGKSAN